MLYVVERLFSFLGFTSKASRLTFLTRKDSQSCSPAREDARGPTFRLPLEGVGETQVLSWLSIGIVGVSLYFIDFHIFAACSHTLQKYENFVELSKDTSE